MHGKIRLVFVVVAALSCGDDGGSALAPDAAVDHGCAAESDRGGLRLVWCPAVGGSCASPAACAQIGGSPPLAPGGEDGEGEAPGGDGEGETPGGEGGEGEGPSPVSEDPDPDSLRSGSGLPSPP